MARLLPAVACANELEHLIAREGADTIAAFVAEPIGGSTAGALVPPDEYWPTIAAICHRHGILLIAVELRRELPSAGSDSRH